ncbi:Peptidyl-prolyl cis-trans isomerase FKBP16-3, chloroplastic [Auxenochlorella protothecoides]|uniref:peptidylprolyl isomerase n=1 Tax=Auxenochlorella protothecoides TaxID=3075 RepID=A0A087SFM2_AUXPR|nr:Peptidyl-prolyl cis-trans isomerase FKBP16-3, chloroplastic [Auxenochlorella protothecoides]KFM24526.1 Peptidyl-prolyl cis-trans isomerase FKBP16-3, chloroplastic [Auxenochlorella protothecoides]
MVLNAMAFLTGTGTSTHIFSPATPQLVQAGLLSTLALQLLPRQAEASLDSKVLCDADCAASLADKERVRTASGLEYIDLVPGKGPSPRIGFQASAGPRHAGPQGPWLVVCDYVASTPQGAVFDSSLDRGAPYIIRVGAGQIVAGLDEGLQSMKLGGVRRLYVPGLLAFPKGLSAAAGRPRVPPASPVVFDVSLVMIPGLEDEEEE